MLFGEDSLKGLKKELKSVGADVSYVKSWQKVYDKVRKNSGQIAAQYTQAKQDLQQVHAVLKDMEEILIARAGKLSECEKNLKKYQGRFNHEFLIGKEDKEFHLTYQTILSLCANGRKTQKEVLILQSEVENILAVTEEALQKEWPDFRAMAYFYLNRTDKEIFDLPHGDKVAEVNRIYEVEFLEPMRAVLNKSLGEERASQILEVDIWN